MEQPIRCVIVDDEPASRDLLSRYIEKHPYLELIKTFSDGKSAYLYLKASPPDLLFLDISMPGLSGLELISSLNAAGSVFIFVTAYSHYASEAFDLDAVDYLLKPVSYERFCKAVIKAIRRRGDVHRETLNLTCGKEIFRIPMDQIAWMEADNYYLEIYGDAFANSKITLRYPLYKVEKLLNPAVFFKLNRGVVVNVNYVRSVKKHEVLLRNGKSVPVSRAHKEVLEKLGNVLREQGI